MIYVCMLEDLSGNSRMVFYDKDGNDPMELSSIDIDEFKRVYYKNKDKK